jgi:hypothetical protein
VIFFISNAVAPFPHWIGNDPIDSERCTHGHI